MPDMNPLVQHGGGATRSRISLPAKFLLACLISLLGFAAIMVFLLLNGPAGKDEWWLLIPALTLAAGAWIFGVSWWRVRKDRR